MKFESFSSARPSQFGIRIPLWFPLVLLLIVPLCWVTAQPVSGPAFPVVTTRVKPPHDNSNLRRFMKAVDELGLEQVSD